MSALNVLIYPMWANLYVFFEAGVITGVFTELTKKDVTAKELRCWTSGYSFCQFDVKIKDQKK